MADGMARRRPGAALRRLLALAAAVSVALAAAALGARAEAQQCAHATGERLLDRLEQRFDRCVGASAFPEAREALVSAFTSNEFDRQAPLALALFSNSSGALDALASAVATSLFGDGPWPRATQVADFARLLRAEGGARPSNYELKQALRASLAAPLRACPSRSLLVLRNVQALDDAALPVLDVFLDPLNGRRALFQSLDCTNAVFLFLFHVEPATDAADDAANASRLWTVPDARPGAWREFLMRRWTRPAETHAAEEFTPQALVGRLTAGVALMAHWAPVEAARACQFPPSGADQREGEAPPREDAAADGGVTLAAAFVLLLPFLWLLAAAKDWNQQTARKREREKLGRITRHKGRSRKPRRKRW